MGKQGIEEGETVDTILGGRLQILQQAKGYRFSIDAILLAGFLRSGREDRLIDLGTGSGIISLILAAGGQCAYAVGIEIQPELAELAERTVESNGLAGTIRICQGDIREIALLVEERSFDWAVFNPPYRKLRSGRINPDNQKAVARHEIKGTLDDFLKASRYALKTAGRASLIYPASRLVEVITRMRANRIEPKRLQMVHSYRGTGGEFVLLEGVKGGREELEVLKPLVIYEDGGGYTDEVSAMLNGRLSSPAAAGE
jgi:tRNA1Val (adenine37-N6)-methyltransferase